MNKLRSSSQLLWAFIIILRFAICNMPIASVLTDSIINIGSFALLFLLCVFQNKNELLNKLEILFPIFLFWLLPVIHTPSSLLNQTYNLFQELLWPLICLTILEKFDRRVIKLILLGIILVYGITAVTTYLGCKQFPNASRDLATGMFDDEGQFTLYKMKNIGGFSFIYSIVLTLPIIIFLFRFHKCNRLLPIIIYALILTLCITTEYTTAVIIAIVSLAVFLLPKQFSSSKLNILFIEMCVLVYILTVLPISFYHSIASTFNSEQIAERVSDLGHIVRGDGITEGTDASERMAAYQISLNSFISKPLIGSNISGGHSFILDILAKYGIIGLIILIISFRRMFIYFIKRYYGTSIYGYLQIVFILNLFLCIINTQNYTTILSFVIPIICFVFDDEKLTLIEDGQ